MAQFLSCRVVHKPRVQKRFLSILFPLLFHGHLFSKFGFCIFFLNLAFDKCPDFVHVVYECPLFKNENSNNQKPKNSKVDYGMQVVYTIKQGQFLMEKIDTSKLQFCVIYSFLQMEITEIRNSTSKLNIPKATHFCHC